MDNKTKEFYEAHKDKDFTYPSIPSTINEKEGVPVCKWVMQQMLDNNIGWLELDVASVNNREYEDIALTHKTRLETDRLVPHMKKIPLGIDGITLYNSKWLYIDGADVTELSKWWFEHMAGDKLTKINVWRMKPNEYVPPHNFNIKEPTNNIDNLDMIDYPFPIVVNMVEPGLDCHTVVEGMGIVPNQLGKIFLINPNLERCMVNKGKTDSIRMYGYIRPGMEFQRWCDLITRSYMKQLSIQDA